MNTIARLEKQLAALRQQLSACTDPEESGDIGEKIDFIEQDIKELESEVDPEDVYGIFGHNDSPSLEVSLNY